MANTERCLAVADMAEKYPLAHRQFSFTSEEKGDPGNLTWDDIYRQLTTGCGTTACLAGWTMAMFARESFRYGQTRSYTEAQELLGLDSSQFDKVFGCFNEKEAIALLRQYAWT